MDNLSNNHNLKIVMMAAYYLTPIHTSSEKGELISWHIKGPLDAAYKDHA